MRYTGGGVLVVALALWSVVPGLLTPSRTLAAAAADTNRAFTPTFTAEGANLAPGVTLRLAALGRGDTVTSVSTVFPTDDGTRVSYAHGGVTEWYLRQGGGIEQGITLASPPSGNGMLTLTIATPGAAVLVNDTVDAATLIAPGASTRDTARFQYHGLHVTDATGHTLSAHLVQAAGGGIGIMVEDTDALYPITVDPFVQRQAITDPAATNGDGFGYALALSADGSTLAVGAPGVQGKTYLYSRCGGTFTLIATLADPATAASDYIGNYFGSAVALSGDGSTLAVGASFTTFNQGKAYVYTRSGSTVTLIATLAGPAATNYDRFGYAVALSGDGSTLAVGAYLTSGGQGKTHLYSRSGSTVTLIATLSDPAATIYDYFGSAVALSTDGSTLAVGAIGTSGEGAAYVYTRSDSTFTLIATLADPGITASDYFGSAVALSGDGSTLAVGASFTTFNQGKAYLYTRSGSTFTLIATLADPAAPNGDEFGISVALSGDGSALAVGAFLTNSQQGAAYLYSHSGTTVTLIATLSDPAATIYDYFGSAVALSADGSTVAVSARNTNSGQGRVYIFTKQTTTTALTSSPNPSTFGQAIAFTATVAAPMGATTPTGTVTFTSGATTLGTAVLSASGVATFTPTALPVGVNQTVTATYSGTPNFATSSGTTSVTVNPVTIILTAPTGTGSGNSGSATMPSIRAGGSITLSANPNAGVTYTSSNPNIAAVDPTTGVVTGISAGTVTIMASGPNGSSGSITLTITGATGGGLVAPAPMAHPAGMASTAEGGATPVAQPTRRVDGMGSSGSGSIGGVQPQAAGATAAPSATPGAQPARR